MDPGIDSGDGSNKTVTAPVTSPATKSNPNSPTLLKAGALNGLTIDIRTLQADFIDLGEASDLDGDSVTVSFEVSPSTNLISFDEGSNSVDLSVEALFELTQASGPQTFELTVIATDTNKLPRSTTYFFKIKVPTLSQDEIGAYYEGLIYERLGLAYNEKNPNERIPFIEEVIVSQTGEVFVHFSDLMLTKSPSDITPSSLALELISKSGAGATGGNKQFSWTTLEFT